MPPAHYLTGKNITDIYRLYPVELDSPSIELGYFVVMRNKKTMYIGEVLDIYKKGNNSKYGSIEFATTASSLSFLAVRVYLPLQLGHVCRRSVVIQVIADSSNSNHRHLTMNQMA
jgi:hypothetical protein